MAPTNTFGTQLVGQTENAFGAILDRELVGTGLGRAHWIGLTVTVMSGGKLDREALATRLAGALKLTAADANARLEELASRDLIALPPDGGPVSATAVGAALHARIHGAVTAITQRLWGDISPDDLATAGMVLSTVLERANLELEGDPR